MTMNYLQNSVRFGLRLGGKKALLIQEHRTKKRTAESCPIVPRKFDKDRKFTADRILVQPWTELVADLRGRKRERSLSRSAGDDMEIDAQQSNKKLRARSRSRPKPRAPEEEKDSETLIRRRRQSRRRRTLQSICSRRGEADRGYSDIETKVFVL
jgi:nucleolar GTP-binding protein